MEKETEIIKRLKLLRLEANISESEMGEHIGLSGKVVNAIESGNRPIGLRTLILWAEKLGKKLIIELV